ncbi:MAG: hypothetical protein CMM02_09895 [Rhodopirellula sp.]|nr:hypothetical protein [Rhodopirellula sp.]
MSRISNFAGFVFPLSVGFILIALFNDYAVGFEETPQTQKEEHFKNKVLPLLKARCYSCHSHDSGKAKGGLVLDSKQGWQKGGGLGTAIVPGVPDESLLIQAVRYDGLEMPPGEKLNANEIRTLELWVKDGAFDNRKSKEIPIGKGALWALAPIVRPETPAVQNRAWVLDPIDQFILSRLEAKGLKPAGPADRYSLLRRVTFDLIGLPPTPEEIDAFITDESEDAYAKVVDRLLESPAFGERWARHWFDLSCYADVQRNTLIGEAWRYRDYVINAFNSDRPFDRFIHEQIAGDLLPASSVRERRELMVATGYLSIGPWVIENYIKPQLVADIVDHQIDRIGRTFLGQTVSCARCHDHKFDPIPTRDYYAMAGIFHSSLTTEHTGPGVWSSIVEHELPVLPADSQTLAKARIRKEALLAELRQAELELLDWHREFPLASNANVSISDPVVANEGGREYVLSFDSASTVWAGASQATKAGDALLVELIDPQGKLIKRTSVLQRGWPGSKELPQLQNHVVKYTGTGTGRIQIRITSAQPGNGRFAGLIDNLAIVSGDSTLFAETFDDFAMPPISGKQAHTQAKLFAQVAYPGWSGLGINHSHVAELEPDNYALQIFSGNMSDFKKLATTATGEGKRLQDAVDNETRVNRFNAELAKLSDSNEPEFAMSLTDIAKPSDVPIYRRGDFNLPGEVVPRGVLSLTNLQNDSSVPVDQSGRLQLAQWLTGADNTLTTRVLVNRVWHHLFGKGIVASVDYFGVHGDRPSHPNLLDHLASRFRVDNQWSLKQLIRQIVLTQTYRMSSVGDVEKDKIDPENELLWRMNRRRLTAEAMRDAMLQISGELDSGNGGSPLGLELEGNIRGAGGNVNPPTWGGKVPEYVKLQRTVYQPLKRHPPAGELEILSVFNFPHPNDITGARAQTTVATQALFLMNAPFVKERARQLNKRIHELEFQSEVAKLDFAYLLVVGRPPSMSEMRVAQRFIDSLSESDVMQVGNPARRKDAWEQLCHGLLISNSFLFKE